MKTNLFLAFALSLALVGCGSLPKSEINKSYPIQYNKRDFKILTKVTIIDGQCQPGEIMVSVLADGLVPNSLKYPIDSTGQHITKPLSKIEMCAQVTENVKFKSGDIVDVEIDTDDHLQITGKFTTATNCIPCRTTISNQNPGKKSLIDYSPVRDCRCPSPYVNYFVQPPDSYCCHP
jgi:hypothetical protein